ncbi:unnamed protein product [Caenorhabditis nigoni]
MQAWEYRETDSPLPSDVTLHSLKPVETDSAMSIASDFDETFWDQELNRGRSQSFGGTTQYSQQFMRTKILGRPCFKTSLETVDSGTNSSSPKMCNKNQGFDHQSPYNDRDGSNCVLLLKLLSPLFLLQH